MQLYSLKIEGYRRHLDTEVSFSDATFLIGENNIGKSSILSALNILLNDVKKVTEEEFFSFMEEGLVTNVRGVNQVVLTAEFRDVPEEARDWLGFKGRVLKYIKENNEIGYRIVYKKTFAPNVDYVVELRQQIKQRKSQYDECTTLNQFLHSGLDITEVADKLTGVDHEKKLGKKEIGILEDLEDLYDYDEDNEEWFRNPGGIPANVLTKLPKFLLIPAQDKTEELSGSSGALISTLNELFNDVREASDNYRQAQTFLNLLAAELNPENTDSEFGRMMTELNDVMRVVFPNSGLKALTTLADADKVIKPQFKISMFSNITTSVNLQGTGMIRSAVFALLRYRNLRENRRNTGNPRPLIIGFEEPEIYLHPNAAKQMRDTIYELAGAQNNQIVCTTHSPYMIDLSKRPMQILNCLSKEKTPLNLADRQIEIEKLKCFAFNTSEEFSKLQGNDKTYVKMLLKIDDYIARVFFSKHVLIVEGDTEDIILRETINRMPDLIRKDVECNWQIIKARGKATIVSLVKYLKAMGISPVVIHDKDEGNVRAEVFNNPILEALGGDASKRIMLSNCIEDVLGYASPTNEKPFKAYSYISQNWNDDWDSVTAQWKDIVTTVFRESFNLVHMTASEEIQLGLAQAAVAVQNSEE
ncbi:ATP-dependent endonuclease [Paenibacillus sp. V4I5]|uniref:AAA family ATPase n=1 Tax=Paenibacillus sp. V4I5 TaxID=3042306 RepID=UPI002793E3A9|nr:ATP-dependent endonuclease [Paenibacillus sp. V4I5]MDQ0913943.1 putative ATP-dependent endonuclease of OLD family [Paenibacillus sp. V4I5]